MDLSPTRRREDDENTVSSSEMCPKRTREEICIHSQQFIPAAVVWSGDIDMCSCVCCEICAEQCVIM